MLRKRAKKKSDYFIFYFLDPFHVDFKKSRYQFLIVSSEWSVLLDSLPLFLWIHAYCISLIAHFQWILLYIILFVCLFYVCVYQMELLVRLNLTLNFVFICDCLLTQPKWQFYMNVRAQAHVFIIYISCINFSLFPVLSIVYFYWLFYFLQRIEWTFFFVTFGQHLFVTKKNSLNQQHTQIHRFMVNIKIVWCFFIFGYYDRWILSKYLQKFIYGFVYI